jgi:hypothetical protein
MQNAAPVQLNQVRDFGQIISATFLFLKQNWRPLLRAISFLCVPFALVGGFLAANWGGGLQGFQFNPENVAEILPAFLDSLFIIIPAYILLMIGFILLIAISHEYMRAYSLNEHVGITPSDLLKRAAPQFLRYTGLTIVLTILTIVSGLLCFFPLLYVGTIISLSYPVLAIERKGTFGSIGRSVQLVNQDFWWTLLIMIVILLVYYSISFFVQLPVIVVGAVVGFNTALDSLREGGAPEFPAWFTMFSAISNSISLATGMLIYPIWVVARSLKYFSMIERTEGTSLRAKVEGFEGA